MYKANNTTQFVATKTISVKPEAQVDYNPKSMNQVRWLIPQYVGFFDPRQTMMKYNLRMSGRGYAKPDAMAGVHSLWRDIRVRDGTGAAELEMLQDYNVFTAQWWHYTTNESINHKRDLFEGRSANYDLNNQLYFEAPGDWASNPVTATTDRKTLEIEQPIHSGILGGNKVFPVVATKGLRVEMTLDDVQRSLVNTTDGGTSSIPCALKVAKAAANDNKAAIGDAFTVAVKSTALPAGAFGVSRNAEPTNNNPFDIGDPLYISLADGTQEKLLGIITQFDKDGDNDLVISYIPTRANGVALGTDYPIDSKLYYKNSDRVSGYTATNVPAQQVADAAQQISYTISNLEMLLLQVQPPAEYAQDLQTQINSEKGLSMDYRTHTLYRFNLTTLNGLTNQLIPAQQTRAYSVFSLPLAQSAQNNVDVSSFRGQTNGCQNYQYTFGGSLIPDRPISLVRYNQNPQRTDALHVIELEKALMNANYGVRNLLAVPRHFIIGRAFSKSNQVFNLSDASLSLRVEYSGATEEKLFEHFVCYLKRVNISANGVMVMS